MFVPVTIQDLHFQPQMSWSFLCSVSSVNRGYEGQDQHFCRKCDRTSCDTSDNVCRNLQN